MPALNATMEWIESQGGPLLLLPQHLLGAWEGADPPSHGRAVEAAFRYHPSGPATDYDRACDVRDIIAAIEVGEGLGLVLGDEPLPTAWLPLGAETGVLARWRYGPSEETVQHSVAAATSLIGWQGGLKIAFRSRPLVLFDAAEPGSDPTGARLVVDLGPGQYLVETLEFRPNPELALLLHRLRPAAA